MYFCPKCRVEVPANARFCGNCGYKPGTPATSQVQPHTPSVVPSIASIPTRSVQSVAKRIPTRPHPAQSAGSQVPNTRKPAPPSNQQEKQQSAPAGLIRPVGATPSKEPTLSTPPEQANKDDLIPLQSTPAHLLALTPVTPPSTLMLPPQTQTPMLNGPRPQQFRPSFIPATEPRELREQKLEPIQVGEQLVQQGQSAQRPQPQSPVQHPPTQPQIENQPTAQMPPIEIAKGRPQSIDADETFTDSNFNNASFKEVDEGFVVTSKAAEHWRTSWRNRQRTEAGPATTVSRGQSSVAEPLLAMQHSLMRIRAVVVPQRMQQQQKNATLGFWITFFLLVSLIGGLAAYIGYTYLPNVDSAARLDAPVDIPQPGLRLQGTQVATIVQGQPLHLHGDNFNAGAPIIFLLDGDTTISNSNGRQIAVLASDQGSFDVAVPTLVWPVGTHVITAQDNKDGQSAYLNIQVNLKASGDTANADMAVSVFPRLTFQATVGQGNLPKKVITLTNKNTTTPLEWTAMVTVDKNLSWLIIDPATTSGNISIGGTGKLGVSVDIAGLKSNSKPYTGKIVFTINKREQLTLPVELQIQDAAAEIVISPNPLVAVLDVSGNACQADAQLLLVNISNAAISWSIDLNDKSSQHIQFMHAGEPAMQGQLAPAGQQGDTQVLTLQCIHVQNGQVYSFTVTANNVPWSATVLIQAKP